jgi:hypothetical protein
MRTPAVLLSVALMSAGHAADPKAEALTKERASAFAKLALKNIDQEFPH